MKLIYICSPYEGAEHEYKAAVEYGRYVKDSGYVPIIPHVMYHGVLNQSVFEEKQSYMQTAELFMQMCDELWVFGKQRTFGMKEELALALKLGIEVKYIAPVKTAMTNDVLRQICRDYEATTGFCINGAIGDDIMFYLECGITKEVISYAITAQARKNAGWNYARAILERCRAERIKTAEDLKRIGKKQNSSNASYNIDEFEKMLMDPD